MSGKRAEAITKGMARDVPQGKSCAAGAMFNFKNTEKRAGRLATFYSVAGAR